MPDFRPVFTWARWLTCSCFSSRKNSKQYGQFNNSAPLASGAPTPIAATYQPSASPDLFVIGE
ncbi:Fc.00g079080.m01.CDS01 [Cosmosporella sp. VM-42]